MGKWGTFGHKYTFVKVGYIGAQIYIVKVGIYWESEACWVKWGTLGHKYTFVKIGHIGAQIYICQSGANWKSGAHWDTNIH